MNKYRVDIRVSEIRPIQTEGNHRLPVIIETHTGPQVGEEPFCELHHLADRIRQRFRYRLGDESNTRRERIGRPEIDIHGQEAILRQSREYLLNQIDAVELVRKIRDKHYEETKNMNPIGKIEFIRKKAEELEKHAPVGNRK